MPTALREVIAEIGHWAGLLPLAVCALLVLRKRQPSNDAWVLALAFSTSYVADQFAHELALAKVNTWWLAYVYVPVQFWLFAKVVLPAREIRSFATVGLFMLAVLAGLRGTLDQPEMVVHVLGGIALAWLMWGQDSPYRLPVTVYCAGAVLMLALAVIPMSNVLVWDIAWSVYQAVRVAALSLMAWVLVRPPRLRLEVTDGSGAAETAARRWRLWRWHHRSAVRGGSRDVVAAARKTG